MQVAKRLLAKRRSSAFTHRKATDTPQRTIHDQPFNQPSGRRQPQYCLCNKGTRQHSPIMLRSPASTPSRTHKLFDTQPLHGMYHLHQFWRQHANLVRNSCGMMFQRCMIPFRCVVFIAGVDEVVRIFILASNGRPLLPLFAIYPAINSGQTWCFARTSF